MEALIIQLNDIHIRSKEDVILHRIPKIVSAVKNIGTTKVAIFLVFAGDIAFSGIEYEYKIAGEFLTSLRAGISSATGVYPDIILVPGNHDCYLPDKDKAVREQKIKEILEHQNDDTDSLYEFCSAAQKSFHCFNKIVNPFNFFGESIFYTEYKYRYGRFNIKFKCYNSSILSKRNEIPGDLYLPVEKFPSNNSSEHLVVSVIHHPYNWFQPTNARDLVKIIEKGSNIVLTGHEHVSDGSVRKNLLIKNHVYWYDGGVLQESGSSEISFNVVLISLENSQFQFMQFAWNATMYIEQSSAQWESLILDANDNHKRFQLNEEAEKKYKDVGANFLHPYKEHIELTDIYVYPTLQILDAKINNSELDTIDGEELINDLKSKDSILIIGEEKSGKTALTQHLMLTQGKENWVPIYILGSQIKNASSEKLYNLVLNCFKRDYREKDSESFRQLDKKNIFIILDDFQSCKLPAKFKADLVAILTKEYRCLILANESFQIEELLIENHDENPFSEMEKYELLKFGHLLRRKLIEKWYSIGGSGEVVLDSHLGKIDNAKDTIDVIIGKNFVPSFPIFLLTLLQSIDSSHATDLRDSTFGHYYEFLISKSLGEHVKKYADLSLYVNYLSELCFFLHQMDSMEISTEKLSVFHKNYCEEYSIETSLDYLMRTLLAASVVEKLEDVVRIKYRYIYYYYVARYLSDNIGRDDIKYIIASKVASLHVENNANIVIFLAHLSKDPFIITQILLTAKQIFEGVPIITFEGDTKEINGLMTQVPQYILENKSTKKIREEEDRGRDSIERKGVNAETEVLVKVSAEKEETFNEVIDPISKTNAAYKTIEIMGQILKNHYGALKGSQKEELIEELYLLGLRSMNQFFIVLQGNIEGLVAFFANNPLLVDAKTDLEKEQKSKELLFKVCRLISGSFVKRISSAVGTENLSASFQKVLDRNRSTAVELIDISVKLDYFTSFPISEVESLAKKINSNLLPLMLLKTFTLRRLYMRETDYKIKQRICNTLGITMRAQRNLSIKSKAIR